MAKNLLFLLIFLPVMAPVVAIGFLLGLLWWSLLAGILRAYEFQNWLSESDVQPWKKKFRVTEGKSAP